MVRIVGEGLGIGDHDEHLVVLPGILQLYPPLQRAYM